MGDSPPAMRLKDFDYDLPPTHIARYPCAQRDAARLLVLDRPARLSHRHVRDLPELFDPDDLVVLNDTRVFPARLRGRKQSGGSVELLLCEPEAPDGPTQCWRALYTSSKPLRPGAVVQLGTALEATLLEPLGEGLGRFRLEAPQGVHAAIEAHGEVPLPPYLGRAPEEIDRERYQTVYARAEGAVAAPTAGLHFTPALLGALEDRGVRIAFLTLHVGPGTFLPVRSERVEDHRMHAETFVIPEKTAEAVRAARCAGRRVIAVGTTSLRALESAADRGQVRAGSGRTDLFIYPGFRFQVVTALFTNFHLPRSTLLLLAAAFASREAILSAYAEAVREGYRFYSYGDAMLIR
jgi:S-adenosylmethionine:tRNA ribosyltransferase-isomerase